MRTCQVQTSQFRKRVVGECIEEHFESFLSDRIGYASLSLRVDTSQSERFQLVETAHAESAVPEFDSPHSDSVSFQIQRRQLRSHVGDLERSKKLEEGIVADAISREIDLLQLTDLVFKAEARELFAPFLSDVVVWNRQTAEIGTGNAADRITQSSPVLFSQLGLLVALLRDPVESGNSLENPVGKEGA